MNKKLILLPLLAFALVACDQTSVPSTPSVDPSTSTSEEQPSTTETFTVTYTAGENDPTDLSIIVSDGAQSSGTELTNGGSKDFASGTPIAFYISTVTTITSVTFGSTVLTEGTLAGMYQTTMPAADTALTVAFYEAPVPHAITWDLDTVRRADVQFFNSSDEQTGVQYTLAEIAAMEPGKQIYITYWRYGYSLTGVKYNDIACELVDNMYYFEMPNEDVWLEFEFAGTSEFYTITVDDSFNNLTAMGFYSEYSGAGAPDSDAAIARTALTQIRSGMDIYIQALSDTQTVTAVLYDSTPCEVINTQQGMYYFAMPARNVTISVTFEGGEATTPTVSYRGSADDPADLSIEVYGNSGTTTELARGNTATFDAGELVYLSIYSATGFTKDYNVKANDDTLTALSGSIYTFTMGTESIVITIEYINAEDPNAPHSISYQFAGASIGADEATFEIADDVSKLNGMSQDDISSAIAGTTIYLGQLYLSESYQVTSVTMNGETLTADTTLIQYVTVWTFTMPSVDAVITINIA